MIYKRNNMPLQFSTEHLYISMQAEKRVQEQHMLMYIVNTASTSLLGIP